MIESVWDVMDFFMKLLWHCRWEARHLFIHIVQIFLIMRKEELV